MLLFSPSVFPSLPSSSLIHIIVRQSSFFTTSERATNPPQGAGETLRGTLNSSVDRRFNAPPDKVAQHEQVANVGQQEISGGKLLHGQDPGRYQQGEYQQGGYAPQPSGQRTAPMPYGGSGAGTGVGSQGASGGGGGYGGYGGTNAASGQQGGTGRGTGNPLKGILRNSGR